MLAKLLAIYMCLFLLIYVYFVCFTFIVFVISMPIAIHKGLNLAIDNTYPKTKKKIILRFSNLLFHYIASYEIYNHCVRNYNI